MEHHMKRMERKELSKLFASVARVMDEKCKELCEMDAKLGDGDLGLTMQKGFGMLPEVLRELDEADIGKCLVKAGMKMASCVPSTMGTLMAIGIMSGGKAVVGIGVWDAATYAKYLCGFAEGIAKRGKCARGDCTVLDAVASAAEALRETLKTYPSMTLAEASKIAYDGALAGVEATKTMQPKYGKAAVHKKACVGIADQGACAGLYMIEGYRAYFQKE